MPAYLPPVDRLLSLGEAPARAREWPDYRDLGLTRDHLADLVRMATDPALHRGTNADAVWAPVHAWRTLGQLGDARAAAPLLEALGDAGDDDDYLLDDLPTALGMLGPDALPPLAAFLGRRDLGPFQRGGAAQAIAALGGAYPEARPACVDALAGALAHHAVQDPLFNALLAGALVDLRAVEAAPALERAFAAGDVDPTVLGDWEDVQIQLGVLDARRTPRPHYAALAGLSRPDLQARVRRMQEAERQAAARPARAKAERQAAKAKRRQAAASRRRNRRR